MILLVLFDSFFIDLLVIGRIRPSFLNIPNATNIDTMKDHGLIKNSGDENKGEQVDNPGSERSGKHKQEHAQRIGERNQAYHFHGYGYFFHKSDKHNIQIEEGVYNCDHPYFLRNRKVYTGHVGDKTDDCQNLENRVNEIMF